MQAEHFDDVIRAANVVHAAVVVVWKHRIFSLSDRSDASTLRLGMHSTPTGRRKRSVLRRRRQRRGVAVCVMDDNLELARNHRKKGKTRPVTPTGRKGTMRGLQMHLSPWTASSYAMLVLASLFSGASATCVARSAAAARFTRSRPASRKRPALLPPRMQLNHKHLAGRTRTGRGWTTLRDAYPRTLDLKSSREYKDLLLKDEAELGTRFTFLAWCRKACDAPRGVFSTRALDMREIDAIGYDMDYTHQGMQNPRGARLPLLEGAPARQEGP